jgi:23S rRNA (cytosine1962-C5)-methyltransferase
MFDQQERFDRIINAAEKRNQLSQTTEAYRLFNGFYEGLPGLVLDRYASALVVLEHGEPGMYTSLIDQIAVWAPSNLPGIAAVLHKQRNPTDERKTKGLLLAGQALPDRISELGVHYALDLRRHQDASFYLDTRNLRLWLFENMPGQRLLNTFSYTGSLGIAAAAGGASLVVQTDLKKDYLDIAQQSFTLNHLLADKAQYIAGDFFRVVGRLRNDGRLFDCVILDPPFFSTTDAGTVNLLGETTRLINKIRPLVAHQGRIVVINNALFFSGREYMAELDQLCQSPYITYETRIPVPADVTGYPETVVTSPPTDPAPFNHPTKIAILKVTRKDMRQ